MSVDNEYFAVRRAYIGDINVEETWKFYDAQSFIEHCVSSDDDLDPSADVRRIQLPPYTKSRDVNELLIGSIKAYLGQNMWGQSRVATVSNPHYMLPRLTVVPKDVYIVDSNDQDLSDLRDYCKNNPRKRVLIWVCSQAKRVKWAKFGLVRPQKSNLCSTRFLPRTLKKWEKNKVHRDNCDNASTYMFYSKITCPVFRELCEIVGRALPGVYCHVPTPRHSHWSNLVIDTAHGLESLAYLQGFAKIGHMSTFRKIVDSIPNFQDVMVEIAKKLQRGAYGETPSSKTAVSAIYSMIAHSKSRVQVRPKPRRWKSREENRPLPKGIRIVEYQES